MNESIASHLQLARAKGGNYMHLLPEGTKQALCGKRRENWYVYAAPPVSGRPLCSKCKAAQTS